MSGVVYRVEGGLYIMLIYAVSNIILTIIQLQSGISIESLILQITSISNDRKIKLGW